MCVCVCVQEYSQGDRHNTSTLLEEQATELKRYPSIQSIISTDYIIIHLDLCHLEGRAGACSSYHWGLREDEGREEQGDATTEGLFLTAQRSCGVCPVVTALNTDVVM